MFCCVFLSFAVICCGLFAVVCCVLLFFCCILLLFTVVCCLLFSFVVFCCGAFRYNKNFKNSKFIFTALAKSDRIEVRFPEGSVFDLSHMGGGVLGGLSMIQRVSIVFVKRAAGVCQALKF